MWSYNWAVLYILPFLSAISIANRGVSRIGGGVGLGGVEGGKNSYLGHPMSSHDVHTVANDTPVGRIITGSKSRSPLPNWCPPWGLLFQLWICRAGKCPWRSIVDPLLTIDCGNTTDDHVFHSKLSFFLSLMPVTSLIIPTNDGPILRHYTFGVLYAWCRMFQSHMRSHSQHHCV